MSTIAYNRVLDQARQLAPDDQLRLLGELAALLQRQITHQKRRSILELEGLGKEIWQGIDAQEYVDRERASWNG